MSNDEHECQANGRAADAVVPRITPQEAQRPSIAAGDALIVGVRDGAEVAREGMVASAINISRAGCAEFRADPAARRSSREFDKVTVIVYCASGGRSAHQQQGAEGTR